MAYNPDTGQTRWPAASEQHCDDMARKYKFQQPANVKDRYKPTGNDVLPVSCVFEGDAQFPLSAIDYSQGDASKEQG